MFHEEHIAVVDRGLLLSGFLECLLLCTSAIRLMLLKPPSPFLLWIAGQRLPT